MRADGALELLGRADHQVKIRGHRVELGEIENWLQEHPSVAGAVVVPRLDGTEVRLTGYVRPDPDHPFEESQLRAHAAVRLPRHMVPGVFVRVDVWPRTPSGKIDRLALPEPWAALSGEVDGTSEAVCWDDATMGALAEVWQNVLGVPLSGPEANFFALGGHSLQAMQVVKGIRARLGVRVSAARMMQSPTLAEQAALVRAAVSAEAAPAANQ
jgi:aryl carrier-like protein